MNFLEESLEGKIVLPFFQRDYVWSEENMENFAPIFLNGEYVGTIITAKLKEGVEIGIRYLPFIHQLKTLYEDSYEPKDWSRLLIDGQQRIATLAFLFYNDHLIFKSPRGKGKIGLWFENHLNVDYEKINEVWNELSNFKTRIFTKL